MSLFGVDLSSPGWWFSTVFVALLVNLVSEPVRRWLSTLAYKAGDKWRDRSIRSQQQFTASVNELVRNPELLTSTVEDEMRLRLMGLLMYVLVAIFMGLSVLLYQHSPTTTNAAAVGRVIRIVCLSMSLVLVTVGMGSVAASNGIRAKVKAARKILIAGVKYE